MSAIESKSNSQTIARTESGGQELVSIDTRPVPAVSSDSSALTMRHRPVPARREHRRPYLKWVLLGLLGAATVVGLALAWMPQPVPVERGQVRLGPLLVTVDEDGRTRVKDRYQVSAPLAGMLMRVELHAGDSVRRGEVVARIVPPAAPILDPRTRAEAQGRVEAAAAAMRQAQTAVDRARAASNYARRDADRQRNLLGQGATSAEAAEQAELTERIRGEELESADFGLRVAASEVRIARAALLRLSQLGRNGAEQFEIRAPVEGRLLRVIQESEGPVAVGTPLLEIGDPRSLEVVADVLTGDAVEIRPGAPVTIERWDAASDAVLQGHVSRVEPAAFTKISALGVEEQRVNVLIDLDDPPQRWAALGDGFRVETRIAVWRGEAILQVPAGAVFRHDSGWAAFVIEQGRAHTRRIDIGRRNPAAAQVVRGLRPGEQVVVYPSDNVVDGVRVEAQ